MAYIIICPHCGEQVELRAIDGKPTVEALPVKRSKPPDVPPDEPNEQLRINAILKGGADDDEQS